MIAAPGHQECILAKVMADITRKNHLNPERRTGPTRGSSNEAAATPAALDSPAARPRSSWSTWTCPHSQH